MVRLVPLFLLIAVLCSCGRSNPTMYYAFPFDEQVVLKDRLPGKTIRIARVSIPQYLDREALVIRDKQSAALAVSNFNIWAEPLGEGIRRIVHNVLFEPLLAQGITVLPGATESTGTYTLFLDVLTLDGNLNGQALLKLQWSLVKTDTNKIVCDGIYTAQAPVAGGNYADLVQTEGGLVRDCAAHILGTIQQSAK